MGHGIAITSLAFVPIPQIAFYLMLVVMLWSLLYFVLRDARLTLEDSIVAISLGDDRIILFNRDGDEQVGKLLRSSLIMPQIVILNITLPNHFWKKNVVLMPDSMDAESFRQLRVVMKWGVNLTA